MLRVDRTAQLRKESLVFLRIDREAQLYVERAGIFFEKSYCFQCKEGIREIKYGHWTKVQYQALLAIQKEDPVPLTTDYESGRTWWIFQDKFYWEDYSAREIVDKQREKSNVMKEVKTFFLKGTRDVHGISENAYRFHCNLGQRRIQQRESFTEGKYRSLLGKQRENPVQLLSDRESGRTWWMFRDRFYWGDADLNAIEVKALLLERIRKNERKIEHAISLMENESRSQTYREPLPDSVKLFVWERDQGHCVQCGRDEELEYDHIIPVSKGGSNTEKNIQLLCAACNRSKGANLV